MAGAACFYVYPCANGGGRPPWTGVPKTKSLTDPLHPVRTVGLNLAHPPMPRPLMLTELRLICRSACLSCRKLDCAEHPAGSGMQLERNGSQICLDVTEATLYTRVQGIVARAVARSLVEEEEYIGSKEAAAKSLEVQVQPDLDLDLCLFCAEPYSARHQHLDCPPVSSEEGNGVTTLRFETTEDVARWRNTPRNNRRGPVETVVINISEAPLWTADVCRCCGAPGLASPASVSEDGAALFFDTEASLVRWRAQHQTAAIAELGKLQVKLLKRLPWRGGCQCCGQPGPPAEAPAMQVLHAGDAELRFPTQERADTWAQAHQHVRILNGPLRRRQWTFGPADLLPLLRTMLDFEEHSVIEETLFTTQHVVRPVEGCETKETTLILNQARDVERLSLLLDNVHILYIPRYTRGQARTRISKEHPEALQGDVDCHGRRAQGSLVRCEDELVKYKVGGKVRPVKVCLPNTYEVSWRPEHDTDYIDVALLTEVGVEETAARRQKRQRDLMKLLHAADVGRKTEPRSALILSQRLVKGKHVMRGTNGTMRAQAETNAHRFQQGSTAPIVSVSHVVAAGLKVLRKYEGTREDHLALLRGKEYPGVWQVVCGQKTEALPSRFRVPRDEPIELQYISALCLCGSFAEHALEVCTKFRNERRGAKRTADAQQVLQDLAGQDLRGLLKLLEARAREEGRTELATEIHAARQNPRLCQRECLVNAARTWCEAKGVTHLIAHPVGQDKYYAVRNPVDNAGSVECVTLKVVPGTAWGAGFSAILLIRYGMDYDGDHANFVAVLDILSAQLQETYLTPENRLFMESGKLALAPTRWPLERWCALLEGDNLRLARKDALWILSGAGLLGSLAPELPARKAAWHRIGTRLELVDATAVLLAPPGFTPQRTCGTAISIRQPLCVQVGSPDGPELIVEREDFAPLSATSRALTWRHDALQRCVCFSCPGEGAESAEQSLCLEVEGGGRLYCRASAVWTADITGGDLLACLFSSSLPQSYVVRLREQEIWRGGTQVLGGRTCSLLVPKRGAPSWEALVFHTLISWRTKQARCLQMTRGLGADEEHQTFECACRTKQISCTATGLACWKPLRWALLVLRIRSAWNSSPFDPEDLKQLIANVARDIGKHTALELITKLQMTGYRICPALQARSHPTALYQEQEAVEVCTKALDYAWAVQPPVPFPRSAEATAQLRFRGLAEPCRLLYSKLAAGFRVPHSARCDRCLDCRAQDLRNEYAGPVAGLSVPKSSGERLRSSLEARKALAERLLLACGDSSESQ